MSSFAEFYVKTTNCSPPKLRDRVVFFHHLSMECELPCAAGERSENRDFFFKVQVEATNQDFQPRHQTSRGTRERFKIEERHGEPLR